ncbi:Wzz/FepE/Etk N-terminal domain-containing protein [Gordonia sp. ABSL11-1]|uniref:polysaccharide biosynthesis tyrosine autokinase n=1 Tax=Gordonia sp. ABSL11-1 TaxID=3053924 RepID=UPI002573E333|nr:polysaccharide biosynthesis tyrosine autokinase [Gordonia sp. ABSL11-1]MDL9947969.1 Wzz/FepE/Etk N-terminal domain-containing protein [Gordonia sp. ABSL11-1]
MSNSAVGVTYRPDATGNDWLRSTAGAIRDQWIVIVVCALVGGLVGLVLTTQQTPMYESSATIYQTPRPADSDSVSQQRTEAYTELLTSDRLIATALAQSGLPMSIGEARDATTAGANTGSAILTVTTRTENPQTSATLANALADALPATVAALDGDQPATPVAGDAANADQVRLSVITPAVPDSRGEGRNFGRNIALGIVAGLLVGLFYSYVRGLLGRRVRDEAEVSRFLSGPVLATIPSEKSLGESGIVDYHHPDNRAARALRRLRTTVTGRQSGPATLRSIVVTGASAGDGSTTVAVNLAIALADSGSEVVLVDAALDGRPAGSRHAPDAVSSRDGLTTYLGGGGRLGEFISRTSRSHLSLVPAGPAVGNSSELLASQRLSDGLTELAEQFDHVIVDTASLRESSDPLVVGRIADAVLVVARSGHTRYGDLRTAVERLALADVAVLGVVLNGSPRPAWQFGRGVRAGRPAGQVLADVPPGTAIDTPLPQDR